MKSIRTLKLAAITLVGLSGPALAQVDATGAVAKPRSTNERNVTENPLPPPVNSDYRAAAEGQLPGGPGTVATPGAVNAQGIAPRGAIDPATPLIPGRPGINQMDPAVRIPATTTVGRVGAVPQGLDVAMLIEHAVCMGMEASALQAIADLANPPSGVVDDPARVLSEIAQKEMDGAKTLLAQAAGDGRQVDAASPTRRFYAAAKNYLMTLAGLSATTSPSEKAQVAQVNHAVKAVLDADHIRAFGRAYSGAPATQQLMAHAGLMREKGMQEVMRIAGTGVTDPNAPPSAAILAQRGRELLEAANQVNATLGLAWSDVAPVGSNPAAFLPGQSFPGRLQDTRPLITGGTQGTGSPTEGTATAAEAAAAVKNSTELPNGELVVPTPKGTPGSGVSSYGVGNNNTPPTNSTAGPRPR